LQVLGSMTLFNGSGVSWLSILFAIGVSIAYHQFILLPMMRRLRSLPTENDDDQLEGIEGRVVSALNPTGTVQLRGETWTAYSDRPVESGERVVVIKRDGLQLYVEALKHKHEENGKVQHYE
jgi:membrane-bound serine protease (ClpP class)